MATRPRVTDVEQWERETSQRAAERDVSFSTLWGEPVKPLYTERIVHSRPRYIDP
jgi:hypothetical protein